MFKNIFANFLGRFWSILSNFLFIPLYINYLGFESYSIISFTLVISGLMAVLDAGLTATLSREFARIDNSFEEKLRIYKTLETCYFIITTICVLLVFLSSDYIASEWINIKSFGVDKISCFIKIVSFDIGFQLLLRFYMGGVLGMEKQVEANLWQVLWGITRNGLVVFPLIIYPTLEFFFVWQTISTILFTILMRFVLNKLMIGNYKLNFQFQINKAILRNVWRFAGGMLLISLVSSLNTQIDKIAISKFLPVETLGHYTLAVSLAMSIVIFVNPISTALLPRFTSLYSQGNYETATRIFNKTSLFVSILVFSILINLIFFSKDIIWFWTNDINLAVLASVYLPFVAFGSGMLALQIIPFNIAIANGYTKLNNLMGIVSLLITIPGYWLTTINIGAIGAAYIFCGVQTILTFVYIYFVNKKFLKMESIGKFYIKQMLFPFLISLVVVNVFSLLLNLISFNLISKLLLIGCSTIFTIIINIYLLVSNIEINKTFNLIINRNKN
jgi:O-antigen/teichoic acid export membrane protein